MDLGFVFEKLSENWPKVGGYGLFAFVIGWIAWKAAIFYSETNSAIKDMPDIQKLLSRIDKGLSTLNTVLLDKSVISNSCYSQENSPRVLNPVGKKLYEESGAEELMKRMVDTFLGDLEANKSIDTLLELERESLKVLLRRMDNKEFKDIQDFAFEHPKFEGNPLTYTDILFVMALKLRDRYREKHKEINDEGDENNEKGSISGTAQ